MLLTIDQREITGPGTGAHPSDGGSWFRRVLAPCQALVCTRGPDVPRGFVGDGLLGPAPTFRRVQAVSVTGAGDCFAGGFIGYLAQQGFDLEADHISRGELSRAVVYGSVMGSFCCEQFGVDRFRSLTRAEIDVRFQEFKNFT